MKNLLTLTVIAGMFAFVACGPSAEELAQNAKQDSIRIADSTAAVAAAAEQANADSVAAETAGKEEMKQDSTAHADSVAKNLIKKK